MVLYRRGCGDGTRSAVTNGYVPLALAGFTAQGEEIVKPLPRKHGEHVAVAASC